MLNNTPPKTSLNCEEIDLLLSTSNLSQSKVEDILQPHYNQLVLSLYKQGEKRKVLFALDQRACRFHLTERSFPKTNKRQRFEALLISRICGGIITQAYQVFKERILRIEIRHHENNYILWVRLWASSPNIILTDGAGKIIDAMFRRPARNEISGGYYNPEAFFQQNPVSARSKPPLPCVIIKDMAHPHQEVEAYFTSSETCELERLKERLLTHLSYLEEKIIRRLHSLRKTMAGKSNYELYRKYADLIYSSLSAITKGQSRLLAQDFLNPAINLEIELDPLLTPQENAEHYYNLYKKSKETLKRLEEEEEVLKQELTRLKHWQNRLAQLCDIKQLQEEAQKLFPQSPLGLERKTPGLCFNTSNFIIYVGRSQKENEELYRRWVKGNDLWFHVRDWPGASVFVRGPKGKSVPLEVMLDAANLAVFYSKARQGALVDIFYTQVKYLRRSKNKEGGVFIPTQEKNLTIKLDLKRIQRLKNKE